MKKRSFDLNGVWKKNSVSKAGDVCVCEFVWAANGQTDKHFISKEMVNDADAAAALKKQVWINIPQLERQQQPNPCGTTEGALKASTKTNNNTKAMKSIKDDCRW